MIMAFPFLKIDDIDECWEELNDEMDLGDELENKKFDQFRKYLNDTWMSATATFNRTIWNFHDDENTRTNNISETYNHKINGKILAKNSNIYKVLDVIKIEEMLAYNAYERANLGQNKRSDNKQLLNLQKINNLILQYRFGSIETMDFLIKISDHLKNFDAE